MNRLRFTTDLLEIYFSNFEFFWTLSLNTMHNHKFLPVDAVDS